MVRAFILALAIMQSPVFAKEIELDDDDRKVLGRFTLAEQAYVNQVLDHGFEMPKLQVTQIESLKKGSVGVLVEQGMEVRQIIDDSTALVFGNHVWMEGLDTSGFGEGIAISVPDDMVFYVAGNKRYTTVLGGTKSPKHLIVINEKPLTLTIALIAEKHGFRVWRDRKNNLPAIGRFVRRLGSKVFIADPNGKVSSFKYSEFSSVDQKWLKYKSPIPLASTPVFRTFTDSTGKFSIEAKVKEVSGERVTLTKRTGNETTILISSLSAADQKWIREYKARHKRRP